MKFNLTLLGILALFCVFLSVCAVSANDGVDHQANDGRNWTSCTFTTHIAEPGGGSIYPGKSITNSTFMNDAAQYDDACADNATSHAFMNNTARLIKLHPDVVQPVHS